MKLESLQNLYLHQLKDLYSIEKQLARAFPKFLKAIHDPALKSVLSGHLKETKQQVQRLEHIFNKLETDPGRQRCKAMAGLLRDGKSLVRGKNEQEFIDLNMIPVIQRIEHYEISAYGTAVAYAKKLNEYAAAELLEESLEEEVKADRSLAQLFENQVQPESESRSDYQQGHTQQDQPQSGLSQPGHSPSGHSPGHHNPSHDAYSHNIHRPV